MKAITLTGSERAGSEVASAAGWYGEQRAELKDQFFAAVADDLAALAEAPTISSPDLTVPKSLGARRRRMSRFPFTIIFVERREAYVVIALARLTQRPGYWRERLDR